MKVGTQPDAFLAELSERAELSYADALFGYVTESMLCRIYESAYGEFLWLRSVQSIGAEHYRKKQESCLEFYYVESNKYIAPEKIIPGVPWSETFAEQLQRDLFEAKDKSGILWEVQANAASPQGVDAESHIWIVQATYQEMHIPITVKIMPLANRELVPESRSLPLLAEPGRELCICVYSAESRLSEGFFEIMKMLELIADMGAYHRVNQILKTESVNGRHIMEMLEEKIQAEPKLLREKRMEQIAGYRDYTYMRKRWEQYERRHDMEPEPWAEVVDRILRFGEPIWKALCRREVFFDDWMPELSRYLG